MAGPVAADLTEQAMLDRVPFGGAAGVMADGETQTGVVGEVLEFTLPQARTISIATARIRLDQQVVGVRIARTPQLLPPAANRGDGERGGGRRGTDVDQGLIGRRVIDAIGCGSAQGLAGKIVGIDDIGVAAIPGTGIFKPPNELRLLGVYADDRLAVALKLSLEALDKPVLLVTLRMGLADQTFDVGPERVAQRLEQAPNGGGTASPQALGQGSQATTGVSGRPFGITAGFRLNQPQ